MIESVTKIMLQVKSCRLDRNVNFGKKKKNEPMGFGAFPNS